jgi:hypothetical protein
MKVTNQSKIQNPKSKIAPFPMPRSQFYPPVVLIFFSDPMFRPNVNKLKEVDRVTRSSLSRKGSNPAFLYYVQLNSDRTFVLPCPMPVQDL